ncbi:MULTISPECIES: alpha/beta hydrolase [unclassified Aminobacter]|uniref:alpha/beta fold hydrolase n=1 Tax=unclassified Aminobacter TaxID=2644704 RepID=UPI0004654C3C|nr:MULTISPECIES: alpha/beta hydrolase [unclassified Aminobacter]TWH33570.1 pimeloyl-ACP methyl ester carboxylesterase [Aminobacter sp. J15]
MKPVSLEFAGAEGNRLQADLWDGRGHPVVLLHGGGQTRRAWDATARRIAEAGMRAITVDLRGHGDSEWAASGNYTFRAYGADAAAIFQQVIDKFHARPSAVGASLGGLSALLAETGQGPLIHSLILVDVTPRMDPQGVSKVQGFMGARLDEGFASLEEAADAISAYMPHRKRPRSLDGLRKNLRLCEDGRYRWHWDPAFITSPSNINAGAAATMEELTARLPELRVPTLLVRGMQSELVQEEHAREFVSLAPAATYVDISGAGHMIAGDKNDVFCNAVLDFLREDEAA